MSEAGSLKGAGKLLGESLSMISGATSAAGDGPMPEYENIPVISWVEFKRFFTWRQGEHITALGTTGSGKTTTLIELLERRGHVITFGTKAKDSTLQKLIKRDGYKKISDWPPPQTSAYKKVVLWPKIEEGNAKEIKARQKAIFGEALSGIYRTGAWCLFLDELRYITDFLGLSEEVELIWQQGRSLGISLVGGTQRPRFIPLVAYDQATHLFFWRENDAENLQRLSGIGWTDSKTLKQVISTLPHTRDKGGHFLYLNTRTGEMVISKAELGGT